MLDVRTAAISAYGYADESHTDVTQAMFTEAARQALARGYSYFEVLQAKVSTSAGGIQPSSVTPSGTNVQSHRNMSNPAEGRPRGNMLVRFHKAGEINPNGPGVFDAQKVLR
jgi:hypothetical protein